MLAPPQQAMGIDEGGKTSTLQTKQSDSHDLIIEGLIPINSPLSSFELPCDLNNPKYDNPESLKQSPPVQTVGRPNNPSGYDPNRIPTSIFSSKPTSQTEWSVASNESLFSIHTGNNSFSRDQDILMGKSGEFFNLPTVMERPSDVENYRMSSCTDEDFSVRKEVDITPKAGMKMEFNYSNFTDGRETPTRDGTRTSASTQSGTSSNSFAFPVLTGEAINNGQMKSPREHVINTHVVDRVKIEPEPKPTPKSTRWFSWFSTSFCVCRCSCC